MKILLLSLLAMQNPVGVALPAAPPLQTATIMQIQGKEQFSPLKLRFVETTGIVTLVTAKKDGFWMQDPAGDGDPATSDGLYVTGIPGVVMPTAGDSIRIMGRVEEEQKGNELPRTRLYAVQSPEILSQGNPLPAPVSLTKLPDTSIAEGIAFWEALEGMRVSVENGSIISPTNRFREFNVLAPGNAVAGSGFYPKSGRLLVRSLGGDQVDYNPERIMIGDATITKPTLVSAGDHVISIVGVVDYTFNYYKVQPEPDSIKVEAHEIPKPPVSVRTGPMGNFVITTYNFWDYFDSIPKGKNEPYIYKPEQVAVRNDKMAQAFIQELKLPQIVAVNEVEGTAMDKVCDRLNELAGTHYKTAWEATSDWRGLSMGFLYDSDRVKLLSLSQISSAGVGGAFGQKSAIGNREPLVGVFSVGEGLPPITVIANKIKTKRMEDSPFSLTPPFRFTEIQRKAQMRVIRQYLDDLFAKDPNALVAVTGDLADYDFPEPGEGEDYPLAILKGMNKGQVQMTNLSAKEEEAERYDYIFQGGGVLVSHTLVSPALLKSFVAADILHFNTGFPDQMRWDASTPLKASDRDPLEARFNLVPKKK
jgi:hypothetical protein